ncbi:MAG: hypothetical protein IKU46_00500 [Peptococcaceae bacterium]|nr:hypothetical protein [Peptococcaceae bacterium]
MSILKSWDKFDEKMKDRAIEELLRFMMLFSTSAALICFFATLMQNGDMRLSLILLTFMVVISSAWLAKKRRNEKKWGVAKRTGAEIFRIGMTQPTKEERMGIRPENEKKGKKKKQPQNPSKKKYKK